MAKSKKNIGAFQQAMLSNTKMIQSNEKKETSSKAQPLASKRQVKNVASGVGIDTGIYKKLEEMGKKYNIDPNILVSKGLGLFISLEDYWFAENNR